MTRIGDLGDQLSQPQTFAAIQKNAFMYYHFVKLLCWMINMSEIVWHSLARSRARRDSDLRDKSRETQEKSLAIEKLVKKWPNNG